MSPLGYGAEVAVESAQLGNSTFSVLVIIIICIAVVVAALLVYTLLQPNEASLQNRMQEDLTYIRKGFINASSDILWESVKHKSGNANINRK